MDVVNVTADAEVFTANVYLVPGERTSLIDAGAVEGVVDAIREHVDGVDAAYLTHQHGDHVEQLDAVVEAFDPAVYAYDDHALRTDRLRDGDEVLVGDEYCEVVYTPGHASDHVSLLGPSSLYSGDVVVANDGAFDYGSFGRTDYPGQSRERLIASVEDLLDRMGEDVEHMYAGHGDPFHGDVRDVVETALVRAKKREPKYPDE